MAIAYQYDASGYFAGEIEDYGILPNNSTDTAPKMKRGLIPRWDGKKWKQHENHKGKKGYLDGQPFTIKEYGALPEGFSETPPEATPEEVAYARMTVIDDEILALEQKTIRPVMAKELGIEEPYDRERLKQLMDQIIELRCERQRLEEI